MLKAAGWSFDQIKRERRVVPSRTYTAGRIYLVGREGKRRQPRVADYVLYYNEDLPVAVVEAKEEGVGALKGLQQAKAYARDLNVRFAYSTDGRGIAEFDFVTNTSRNLRQFRSPDLLWDLTCHTKGGELALAASPKRGVARAFEQRENPYLHLCCPKSQCGKEPFYFQTVATNRVIERVLRGQKRILLTMATGTGKTFVAFQIVWKLKQSGWLDRLHADRPGRVLFIADRVVLRDQAYNTFGPFATGVSDPRHVVGEGREPNLNRELYFGIYQTLDAEDGRKPLYKRYPPEFFDLIIIDECHRSGFGKWNDIFQHFSGATQFGMTATPKQADNIDTYDYFCREEPEVLIDADDPARGKWRPPAYMYSLGQGIEDGFLAPYKVHRVHTSLDRAGLHIEEARGEGATIYVPAETDLRDAYFTPQFEREITLPDRTAKMSEHLAGLLSRFGPMEKTIVFCVDMDHASAVAAELQNHFGHLGYSDYAVPIISEEGDDARRSLERFQNSEAKTPVVATTAELLSTGVDVPSCRNIVFMKTVSSPVLFKQIIGRGSRLDGTTDKLWFRIIDYTNATRLFDRWDRPPEPPPQPPTGPRTADLEVAVRAYTGELLVGASVVVDLGPNEQVGPTLTNQDGIAWFENLPAVPVAVHVAATGYRSRQLRVQLLENQTVSVEVELREEGKAPRKVRVTNLTVTIAEEAIFLIEDTGQELSLDQYVDYTRDTVLGFVPKWAKLRDLWTDRNKRETFLTQLEKASVHPGLLAELKGWSDADTFDVLAHLAYGKPLVTRSERAAAFELKQQVFLKQFKPQAQEVILALVDKYRVGGVEQPADSKVFDLSPFAQMGRAPGVVGRFGSVPTLKQAVEEVEQRLYRAA